MYEGDLRVWFSLLKYSESTFAHACFVLEELFNICKVSNFLTPQHRRGFSANDIYLALLRKHYVLFYIERMCRLSVKPDENLQDIELLGFLQG